MSGDINARLAALPAFPALSGPRVRLRGPRPDDVEDVFTLFSDATAMRYWSSAPMQRLEQAQGRIEEILKSFERGEMVNWLVADRRDDRAIGSCTLFHFDPRHRRAEIGYALRSDLWGRGLASEAVALALDWGFRNLALHRIEADIDPRNDASRKLLARLGFRYEGRLRQRFLVGEEALDSDIFGLLAEDWRQRRNQ